MTQLELNKERGSQGTAEVRREMKGGENSGGENRDGRHILINHCTDSFSLFTLFIHLDSQFMSKYTVFSKLGLWINHSGLIPRVINTRVLSYPLTSHTDV